MTITGIVHLGVDVSKKHLDLSPFDNGPTRIPNDKAGLRQLVKRIQKFNGEVIVGCEASGGYEKALISALVAAEIPVALFNPNQVRHFVRSQGVGAKNDTIDAAMIAVFTRLRHEEDRLFLVPSGNEAQAELRELLDRRSDLLAMIRQEKNRLDPTPGSTSTKSIRKHLKQLEKLFEEIEAAIAEWRKSHPEYDSFWERAAMVKGIGPIVILSLIAYLPELGTVSNKRAAALVGVAPYERQSGDTHMGAHIAGGRPAIRSVLYMAAMAAGRSNPILKEFRDGLIARGKPGKVARVAVMRKLVVLANKIAAVPDFVPQKH